MPPLTTDRRGAYRSLDELADKPEFRRWLDGEFPGWAEDVPDPTRRQIMKLMGASVALAGATACRWPQEEIVPFATRQEGYEPGVPVQFATAMDVAGVATGLVVTSRDGRPIKIEGNGRHPGSRGGTSAQQQAALLEMYDPDRSRFPTRAEPGAGRVRETWDAFEGFLTTRLEAAAGRRGAGIAVLAEASSSPTLAALRDRFRDRFPDATWAEYEALSRDQERAGTAKVFGAPRRVHPRLDVAKVVVSLDEDFVGTHPNAVRLARDWADGRRDPSRGVQRTYAFESCHSLTGTIADRRVAVRSGLIPVVAAALAAELFLEQGRGIPAGFAAMRPVLDSFRRHPLRPDAVRAAAADLLAHPGAGVVLAGPRQPAIVHALAHLINVALGNAGPTVRYTPDPDPARPTHVDAIRGLSERARAGEIDTLFVFGGNPVHDAPADVAFAEALERVPASIHLSTYEDETSRASTWHLPRSHFLESWGDARSWDGVVSSVQPLIEPLWESRSAIEFVAMLAGVETNARDLVRATFDRLVGTSDDKRFRRYLHDGVLPHTAQPLLVPRTVAGDWSEDLGRHVFGGLEDDDDAVEIVFAQDASVHDGRFANNGWLQEMPDPVTKLTWDSVAQFAIETARDLRIEDGDVVRLSHGERTVELPVMVIPGQASGSVTITPGYGRVAAGEVGNGVGVDVYPLRTSDHPWIVTGRVERTRRREELATTQDHHAIDRLGTSERLERVEKLARSVELADYLDDPEHPFHHLHLHDLPQAKLWEAPEYTGHRWAMSIDLNACTGCSACVLACQAENNIPVTGKDEVSRGREMHWIRIDRYFEGDPEAPKTSHQPVTCHHCENAPCEQVCPVAATVHDEDGLNVMVYNRCVGTRYCSNNCPYKVRRFNYFNNHKDREPVEQMMFNPEVTVRARGVMEKCTFCVQRIQSVKIDAKNEGREIADGEVVPACAQACPTRAIAFGDLRDPSSVVRHEHADSRSYTMLDEIFVKPRTRYLARVRNDADEPGARGGHGASGVHADGGEH